MYNPIPAPLSPQERAEGKLPIKDIRIDFTRCKYWIGVGAQPTESVARLLKKAGILPPGWPRVKTIPDPERKIIEPLREADEPEVPPVR